jgi:Xaa-Pro dipeptidase
MLTQRLDNLRSQLEQQDVDCLALVPGPNLRYFTGLDFHLLERAFIVFIPADAETVLVIPDLEVSKWEAKALVSSRIFPWNDKDGPAEAMRQAAQALPEIGTLAVEHLRMRIMEHTLIERYLPNVAIAEGEALIDPLRMRKDAAEVDAMRRAIEISEAALEETVSGVSVGMTERQIANQLMLAMMNGGGQMLPFEPIVLGGPRSALPHGGPGERPLAMGELLLIDFGTTVDGYSSDITRTFVVGQEPDDRLRELYEAVQAANEAGRAAVKPGAAVQDVDRAARRAFEERGLAELFIHRTGHGLGLDIHEAPSVVEGNEMVLDVGMTFTVEPGVYLPDLGGIRIEDNVIVTEDGGESLTTFPRALRVVGG